MDRTSRFQNNLPLSSGSFNKPPPIQNDGVAIKPSQPSLHDRFTSYMKEREEELRVFGGGAALPLSTDEIVRLYEIVLLELTTNLKPVITDLTIIAGEQIAHSEGIADAICARIIEAPVDQKLPSFYLLDSIVKNIGKDYIKHFSARLPEVFCEAYAQVPPSMHQPMRRLFGTWGPDRYFPVPVLQKIEVQLRLPPSVDGQSSGLTSTRASESPRQTQYIHVNPKYLEGQRPFGQSTVDTFGTEGVSSSGRAGMTTSGLRAVKRSLPSATRITGSSSPYRIGPAGPISPSLEDFSTDNSPKRVTLIGREDETSEWRTRNWQGSSSQQLKASAAYNNNISGVDLRGPRALISAYGIDEREKNLNRKHNTAEELDLHGADEKMALRTWQNTEEEEFDWEDMTPASSLPPPGGRHSFIANRGNLSKAQFASVSNSSMIDGVSHTNSGRGSSDKIAPNLRESLMLPHQQSQGHFSAKGGGGSFSENRSFLTGGEQNPAVMGNFSNTDGKFRVPYDSTAPEIQSADAAAPLTKAWHPSKFQNSHIRPSLSALPSQMQIRGQFGMNNAVDQLHSDQQLGRSQANLPHISSIRPGSVPANLQHTAQPNLYLPSPYSEHIPSNASVPPMNYRYFGPSGTTTSNLVPGFSSFHVPRPTLQSLPRGPFPGTAQALPIGSNANQVAQNPPAGPALSGLINSLMAQGLISLSNQDSVGVEFDPDILKVRHESAITSLYAELPRQCKTCGLRFKSQEEHSSHMDWHVNKNRTLRNRKAKPSPKWFVNAAMWLSGTEAMGTEAVPGFLPAENSAEKEEDEEMAVPADEDQNSCALCGEPFEDYYSDDLEEWMYKGAVYMHAPTGATVGMDRSQLGPIVHAKCMSDSHAVSSENNKKDEEDSTEEGSQRKRLRS
ncbi:hypothetical protein ABFS83_14G261900 [Erythranthe nasuta]